MAIASNFPAIRPSLNLDFANAKSLDQRITFGRASAASYYDGKTVAKSEENLLTYSNVFSNAAWIKTACTVDSTTEIAPDGTATATKITSTGDSFIYQSAGLQSDTYTSSIWIKSPALTSIRIGTNTGSQVVTVTQNWTRVSVTAVGNTWFILGASSSFPVGSEITIWRAQVERRSQVSSYTDTTTSPITNYIPILQTASAGVPRFDHNPVTGESLGLLVEEQRTNLFLYSEQFDNAFWLKTNALIGQNVAVAPDGTLTGDKLTENSVNGQHAVSGNVNAVAGTYTLSVYLKAADRTWAAVSIYDIGAGTSYRTFFNLSTGTIGTNAAGNTPTITPVGNGWFRCSVSRAITGGGTGSHSIFVCTGDNALSYQGDGYSGLYIWGAQFGDGAYATSYIKSEASQATRSADSQSISNMGQVGAGTIYIDATVRSGATLSTSGSTTFAATASTRQKTAVAYDATSTRKSINGAAVTSSAGTQGGSNISIAPGATGWISKLSIYPQKFGDAHLQSLTT